MAGSIVVGTLKAILTSDTAQYTAGMRAAADQTKTATTRIKADFLGLNRSALSLGKSLAGAFGVSLTIAGLVSVSRHVVDLASDIVDLSAKTGITTTGIQRLTLAFQGSGVSIETVATSVTRLARNLIGGDKAAVAALEKLGLSVATLKTLAPEQQFLQVADAIGKIQNPTEKAFAAISVFGRGGAELLQGFNGRLQETVRQLEAMGVIIDEKTLRAADDFGDQLGVLQKVGTALIAQVLVPILPGLVKLAEWFANVAAGAVRLSQSVQHFLIASLFEAKAAVLEWAFSMAQASRDLPFLGKLIGASAGTIDALGKAAVEARDTVSAFNMSLDKTGTSTAAVLPPLVGLGETLPTVAKGGREAAASMHAMAEAAAELERQKAFGQSWGLFQSMNIDKAGGIDAIRERGKATLEPLPIPLELTLEEQRLREQLRHAIPTVQQELLIPVGKKMGESIGQGLRSVVDNIPDLFVRAFTGGGGFMGALKALGTQMGEAIVKPMIEAMLKRIAAGKLGQALAGAFGMGGGGGGISTAISAATGAGSIGAAAAGGGAAAGGAGAGGTAATVGGGIGLGTTLAITGGIAGGALLAWAIWKKGLFRGGEESLKVSPRRDKFLAQFGGPGSGEGSGFRRLADRIFALTKSDQLVRNLAAAQHQAEFVSAQTAIVAALTKSGLRVRSFAMGGFVPPGAIVPAMLHGGLHGEDVVPRASAGGGSSIIINIQASAIDAAGMDQVFAKDIIPRMKNALVFNQGGLLSTTQRTVR